MAGPERTIEASVVFYSGTSARPWRAFTYFMGCFACQTFWTAVAVYALTRGVADPAGWLFSAAAYSGAAVVLSVLHRSDRSVVPERPVGNASCKNCGK